MGGAAIEVRRLQWVCRTEDTAAAISPSDGRRCRAAAVFQTRDAASADASSAPEVRARQASKRLSTSKSSGDTGTATFRVLNQRLNSLVASYQLRMLGLALDFGERGRLGACGRPRRSRDDLQLERRAEDLLVIEGVDAKVTAGAQDEPADERNHECQENAIDLHGAFP